MTASKSPQPQLRHSEQEHFHLLHVIRRRADVWPQSKSPGCNVSSAKHRQHLVWHLYQTLRQRNKPPQSEWRHRKFLTTPGDITSYFTAGWTISIPNCGDQNRSFKAKAWFFQTLTRCFLCLHLNRAWAHCCNKTEIEDSAQTRQPSQFQAHRTLKRVTGDTKHAWFERSFSVFNHCRHAVTQPQQNK